MIKRVVIAASIVCSVLTGATAVAMAPVSEVSCMLYENRRIDANGNVIAVWYTYEDCYLVAGADDGGGGGGTASSADPFKNCAGSCMSPCQDSVRSCGSCGNLDKCTYCCGIWKARADAVEGCNLYCKEQNRAAKEVCDGNCLTSFN